MPYPGMSTSEIMSKRMGDFKAGNMHSSTKSGPVVTNRKQAIAIALSESGQSKKKNRMGALSRHMQKMGG